MKIMKGKKQQESITVKVTEEKKNTLHKKDTLQYFHQIIQLQ